MFESLHTAAQAMIWVSIVDAVGFIVIILVLAKTIREQRESYHRIHRDQLDVLIKLLAREEKGQAVCMPWTHQDYAAAKEEAKENHVATGTPEPGDIAGRDG